jgi:hypothetical protein
MHSTTSIPQARPVQHAPPLGRKPAFLAPTDLLAGQTGTRYP